MKFLVTLPFDDDDTGEMWTWASIIEAESLTAALAVAEKIRDEPHLYLALGYGEALTWYHPAEKLKTFSKADWCREFEATTVGTPVVVPLQDVPSFSDEQARVAALYEEKNQ